MLLSLSTRGKLVVLWSIYTGYCLGGIVALLLSTQIQGRWGDILAYAAIAAPGAVLAFVTERIAFPRKKKSQSKVVSSRKAVNSRYKGENA